MVIKEQQHPSRQQWFKAIQQKIEQAQLQTTLKVNHDLLQLYFEIGCSILEMQEQQGWGSQVIDQLSGHIKTHFPAATGFSVRNLKYMTAFAKAYPHFPMVQVPLAQSSDEKVQVSLAQIPWYHHISLLTKVKHLEERVFYIIETAKHQWSRNTMLLQIKSDLFTRQGSAVTNFKSVLPAAHSDLAQQTIKDPYVFDFLQLAAPESNHEVTPSNLMIRNLTNS